MDAIRLNNITKSYDSFTLGPLSASVPQGSVVGFIGENGAGKTTTIKAILGMIRPDSGEIEVLGKKPDPNDGAWKEHIGAVLDACRFPDNLTPKNIGSFLSRVYKTWDSQKYTEYLQRFTVPPEKRVKDLSRGTGMKLSLAAALSHDTRLLILDEATSGLDPVVRNEILDVFLDFVQREDHTIFISSHITTDIEKIADYVLLIHQGKILLYENKDDILSGYGVLKFPKSMKISVPEDELLGTRKNTYGNECLVRSRNIRIPDGAVMDAASLEDVMLFLTKKEAE